ncbi:MAG: LuxR C-terminal-related transcriptional regulator [Planctomycetota bacterium]
MVRLFTSHASPAAGLLGDFFTAIGYALHVCADQADFLELCRRADSGCTVVDLASIAGNATIFLQQVTEACPLPIVVAVPADHLTGGTARVAFLPLQRRSGAAAINRMLQHSRCGSTAAGHSVCGTIETLTPREFDVLVLLLQGSTVKQVGHALGISAKTAQVHRSQILRKTGMDTVTQLLRQLVDEGCSLTSVRAKRS